MALEQQQKEKELFKFKARPVPKAVLDEPKKPVAKRREPLRTLDTELNSDKRARDRAAYEEVKAARTEEREKERHEVEKEKERKEAEELAEFRALASSFKARPMPGCVQKRRQSVGLR